MILRITSQSLRIRLSPEEALQLLEKERLDEEFRVFPSAGFHCSVGLGSAELKVEENGFFCRIPRDHLLGGLREPGRRLPLERFTMGAGYEVTVDIDAFGRG